jgi:hypothetical protein
VGAFAGEGVVGTGAEGVGGGRGQGGASGRPAEDLLGGIPTGFRPGGGTPCGEAGKSGDSSEAGLDEGQSFFVP